MCKDKVNKLFGIGFVINQKVIQKEKINLWQ